MKLTHWIAHIKPWLLFVGYSYKSINQNPNILIQIIDKIVVLYVVLWLEPDTLLSLLPSCASSSTYVLGIKCLDLRWVTGVVVIVEACAIHSIYGGVPIMEGGDALAITWLHITNNKVRWPNTIINLCYVIKGMQPYITYCKLNYQCESAWQCSSLVHHHPWDMRA